MQSLNHQSQASPQLLYTLTTYPLVQINPGASTGPPPNLSLITVNVSYLFPLGMS